MKREFFPCLIFVPALIEKCQRKGFNEVEIVQFSVKIDCLGKGWVILVISFSAEPEKVLREMMDINAFPIADAIIHHHSKVNSGSQRTPTAFHVFWKRPSVLYYIFCPSFPKAS